MAILTENFYNLARHARPCGGHPRLKNLFHIKVVDTRDKRGHDEGGCGYASVSKHYGLTYDFLKWRRLVALLCHGRACLIPSQDKMLWPKLKK